MSSPQLNREVLCGLNSSVARCNPVAVACARLRLALFDQETASVVADGFQPIPPAALRANEVHPEAVDVRVDLAEADESFSAANALEHSEVLPPPHDRAVSPITVANIKPPRDQRTQLPWRKPVFDVASTLPLYGLSSDLGAVEECLFDVIELSLLIVDEPSSAPTADIDGAYHHTASCDLMHLDSVPHTPVFTWPHVLLDSTHVPLALAPDRPIFFEAFSAVNTPIACCSERLRDTHLLAEIPHA